MLEGRSRCRNTPWPKPQRARAFYWEKLGLKPSAKRDGDLLYPWPQRASSGSDRRYGASRLLERRERPCRRRTACTVEAATPIAPADHMRSFAQLFASAQDGLLYEIGGAPGRAMRPARAVGEGLASPAAIDPLGCGLPRAADDECRRRDRQASCDKVTEAMTLTDGQDRICMKIHKRPPSDRDSSTSRTPRRAQ
jgi:hypothetical protein